MDTNIPLAFVTAASSILEINFWERIVRVSAVTTNPVSLQQNYGAFVLEVNDGNKNDGNDCIE
jgi:hypothetical protein